MLHFPLALFLTIVLSSLLSDAKEFPFCKGDFQPNKQRCAKFNFPAAKGQRTCIEPTNSTDYYDLGNITPQKISLHGIKVAQLITNVFENGNTEYQYQYTQRLGDGRGFTCGRVGFTTGTNDAFQVVETYAKRKKAIPFSNLHLVELKRISQLSFCDTKKRDDTTKLQGFDIAWKKAACLDPDFRRVQDEAVLRTYMEPALKFAKMANVKSDLAGAIMFDTIIQNGWHYTEPDINIWRILNLSGGPRKNNESEQQFLMRFIRTRHELVCCANDDVWPESGDRMADWEKVIAAGDLYFKKPVVLKNYGVTIKGTENPNKLNAKECKPFLAAAKKAGN
ncbi:uncharacterized protein VTP21DRAFT_6441 [Calcarisporiella thermophila]|uniref:uncharacterized protein n=1 Tax=Calcarisporiella thermophila TaxID=911321 RepID=UPI0037421A8E